MHSIYSLWHVHQGYSFWSLMAANREYQILEIRKTHMVYLAPSSAFSSIHVAASGEDMMYSAHPFSFFAKLCKSPAFKLLQNTRLMVSGAFTQQCLRHRVCKCAYMMYAFSYVCSIWKMYAWERILRVEDRTKTRNNITVLWPSTTLYFWNSYYKIRYSTHCFATFTRFTG